MIKNSEPLSMNESMKYLEKEDPIAGFLSKFVKLDAEKAEELRKKIEELDLIKVNDNHLAKLIDILPKDKEELNKIFVDASLSEDEANKILETIKEYR